LQACGRDMLLVEYCKVTVARLIKS
jgi:hypothetical protein